MNSSNHGPVAVPDRSRALYYTGTVINEDRREYGVKLFVKLDRAALKRGEVKIPLEVDVFVRTSKTQLGKSVLLKGRIGPARSSTGRNVFVGSIVDGEAKSNNPLGRVLFLSRDYIDRLFRKVLPDPSYDLACGLVLGGSGRVGKEMQSTFCRAGVLHILSVSGLHVGFLIGFLGLIMVFLPLPPRIKFLITAVSLFFYAGLTGFIPTVLRAGLMGLLFGWALIQERNVDGLHVVNMTALMLLAFSPRIIVDLGAQLSYASIYGIVYFFPKLKKHVVDRIRVRSLRSLVSLMGISASAQLFVTPFLIYYFQRIQTMAVFSNLLIVPLSSLITYLLFTMIVAGLMNFPAAHAVGAAVNLLLNGLVAVSRFFAALPGAAPVMVLPFPFLVLFYLLPVRRLWKPSVWCFVSAALIVTLSCLPGASVLRLEPDEARLILPDQSVWSVSTRNDPSRAGFGEAEMVDYLVAPARIMPSRKGYIEFPDEFNYKRISIGEWTVDVRKEIALEYHGRKWVIGDTLYRPDRTMYVLIRGKKALQFSVNKYDTPMSRGITELKIIFLKVALLFG